MGSRRYADHQDDEHRKTHGEDKPVIKKALVELDGKPFKFFEAHREEWASETCFVYPGAIQYYGPAEVCDITTKTLALEQEMITSDPHA